MDGKCAKHDETMDRLFNKINDSEKRLESIDAKLEIIIEFKDMVHKIIFGNGQEGLTSKVRRVCSQLNLQWGLIILTLGALVGYGLSHLMK